MTEAFTSHSATNPTPPQPQPMPPPPPPPLDLDAVGRYLPSGALSRARTLLVRTGHQVARLDDLAKQPSLTGLTGDALLQAPASLTAVEGEFLPLHGTGIQLLSGTDAEDATLAINLQTDSGVFVVEPADTGASLGCSNNLPTVTVHGTAEQLNAMFCGANEATVFFLAGYDDTAAAPLVSLWIGETDAAMAVKAQRDGADLARHLIHIAISTDAAPPEGPAAPEWGGISTQDQALIDALRADGHIDEPLTEEAPDHDALLAQSLREEGLIDNDPQPAQRANDDHQIEQDLWDEGLLEEAPEDDNTDDVDRAVEDALREEGLIEDDPEDEEADQDHRVEQELRDLGLIDDELPDKDAVADQQLEEQLRQEGLIDDESTGAADAEAIEALRAEGLID